jgi:hypothetical protein
MKGTVSCGRTADDTRTHTRKDSVGREGREV